MSEKPQSFSEALKTLGGIAGFLWGGAVGGADPSIGFIPGALVGAILGVMGGWIAALFLTVAVQIALILLFLGLAGIRIVSIIDYFST